MTLPLGPAASSNIASRPYTSSQLTSGWVVLSSVTASIYNPTPKTACPKFTLQVPNVSVTIPTSASPRTPVQNEPVLRLNDGFNLDFFEEEPLVPLAFSASSTATMASQ
ncbi:hypothetical protein DPMN_071713 [Dreissena polymorpha]|uniref:Uncharacterized protein n=1 Tax=Dreissena polymorpha TaxID=45954 RepID=A0A9D4BPW8_DREPO|nr:hypothetical protein DPMN_071713 [Dreissena polymorpha]